MESACPFPLKGYFCREKTRIARIAVIISPAGIAALPAYSITRGVYAHMAYVVTESCIKCKCTDCVDVCPVDCFREGPNMLIIDPDECIDCTLCVAECPVEAIFAEDDVPDDQKPFTSLNAELAKLWKPIIERKPAPPDADEWKSVKDKRDLLEK